MWVVLVYIRSHLFPLFTLNCTVIFFKCIISCSVCNLIYSGIVIVQRQHHQEETEVKADRPRKGRGGRSLVLMVSHNVPNNICRMTELKKLTGVSESFCELNFYILCIKCKKGLHDSSVPCLKFQCRIIV